MPLVFQGQRGGGHRLSGAGIPVGGISRISFLAVQPGVDPGSGGIREILAIVMGRVPASGTRQPQDALLRRQLRGGAGIIAGGVGEGGGIHDGENDWQSRGLPSFFILVMKGLPPAFSILLPILSLAAVANELPQLTVKPWIGSYAGYERRGFQFLVGNDGEGLLTPMGDKDRLLSSRIGIKVQPLIEEVLPDGKVISKMPVDDGWEAVTPASINPEKLTYRGTVAGGGRFEVTLEFDGDQISAGGKLLEKGKLGNPRFVLRFVVPNVYYYDKDEEKREEKSKRDRIDLVRTDGKKLKLDLMTPLDAETEKFNGPGVSQARVDIAGYKDHRFELDAGANAVFEFWNRGEAALIEGFTLGWKPDPAKDPEGKSRVVLKVR